MSHCDDYINDEAAPKVLRDYLRVARAPAHGAFERAKGNDPSLFANYAGKRVRVVMASEIGDVGIAYALNRDHGYDLRVGIEELTNFSDNK